MMTPADPAPRIDVPPALAALHHRYFGAGGHAWLAALPDLAAGSLARWRLRPDGPPTHGTVALVLPVRRADGSPAVLKLQPVDGETRGEPAALRAWGGRHAVRLLDADPPAGVMLLERLDAGRSLDGVPGDLTALRLLSTLLAALHTAPVPPGLRHLADVAAALLERTPRALPRLADPAERRLVASCAGAVAELRDEPGDRLLHWDLHYRNVLAPLAPDRPGEWLAIDPKPLVGDPGFDLLPALHNRWPEVTASGDVSRAVRRRFDLMTEVLGLDRSRAAGWTLGRVLQNVLWDVADGSTRLDAVQEAVARALLDRR